VPSRWLLRFDAVLRAAGLEGALGPDPEIAAAAAARDEPAERRPSPLARAATSAGLAADLDRRYRRHLHRRHLRADARNRLRSAPPHLRLRRAAAGSPTCSPALRKTTSRRAKQRDASRRRTRGGPSVTRSSRSIRWRSTSHA